ncbi:unnamed protein product [Pieris brassicae]|uniref:Retrotransposon gag domain-containing protein n=1 Tax=Pieris brassicae TaxID=7116 RepID=A0A9P0XA84_PIEBR|nr:unnamed protein product [Pieris brassicae]
MESRTLSPGGTKPEVCITDTEDENALLLPPGPITRSKKKPSPTILQTRSELELSILLKFIKPFDGSRNKLNSFLSNCNNASEYQKEILFKFILCQLEGKAETACSIKEFSNWPQLKEFLKTQFSERKHYTHLLTDLQECKQLANEPVSQYALRIETYLSQLLTEISINHGHKNREMYGRTAAMEELALHHFQMGLSPRISNIVRCKSPKSLNEAINIAISEEKIQQFLFKTNSHKEKFTKVSIHKSDPPPTSSNPKSIPFCKYCKNSGHTLENCRKREYNNKFKSQNPRTPQRVHNLIQQDNSNFDSNEGYDTQSKTSDLPTTKSSVSVQQSKTSDLPTTKSSVSVQQNKTSDLPTTKSSVSVQQSKTSDLPTTKSSVSAQECTTNLPKPTRSYEILSDPSKTLLPHVLVDSSVSDIPLSLLVDSGSSISLLKNISIQKQPRIIKESIQIKGIDSSDEAINTAGHFQLKLKISNSTLTHKFHIVNNINLPYDGIIGSDMLNALSCKIDYTKDLLYIDHKPLKWLFNHKDPSSKLQRWRLKLEEYDYEIIYKKGKLNSAADALSRYPVNPILPIEHPSNIPNPQDATLDSGLMDLLVTPPSFNPDDAFMSPIPMETMSHPDIQIDNISDSPIDPQKVLDEFLNLESQPDTAYWPTENSYIQSLTVPGCILTRLGN